MDQEKLIKLQMQMQQNNADYKNFLDDIESWSEEIKDNEKHVTADLKIGTNNNSYPIRNVVVKTKKEKKEKIKAYDYKGWDKYDVEKALEDEDNINTETDNPPLDIVTQKVQNHREVGNIRFKEGNYAEAKMEYSLAIQHDSNNSVLYTNRAASLMKLGSYEAAEEDCCKAMKLDDSSVKAFYRRAKCRLLLSRKEEALEDLHAVMRLDSGNKVAHKELCELERDLNIRGVVQPIFGKPAKGKESSKPLLRVNIVDVDPSKHLAEVVNVSSNSKPTQSSSNQQPVADEVPVFIIPSTAVQLSKDLSKYRRIPLQQAKYILNIPRNLYRKLIGQSLDSVLLQNLVDGLSYSLINSLIPEEVFVDSVNCLSDVARFSSLWMMMSIEEKCQFKVAVDHLDSEIASILKVSV